MSQEEVNAQVAAIQTDLAEAQAANLPASATVNFATIIDALTAAADAIDANGGNTATFRAKIALIQDQSLDLSAIKTASDSHLAAQVNIVDLLVTGSNFDGAEQ